MSFFGNMITGMVPGLSGMFSTDTSDEMKSTASEFEGKSNQLYKEAMKDAVDNMERKNSESNAKRAGAGIDAMGGL
jgi:hypothetical protein